MLSVAIALPLPAGASTPVASKSLVKDLLPAAYAKKAGFTKTVEKATTTSKTGEKSCPNGAQEAFEDAAGQTGVVAEVVACATTQAAATLLSGVKEGTSSASSPPPTRLGSTAIERISSGSTYAIYWRRGQLLELVGLATNLATSGSSTTSTSAPTPPIDPAQQKVLSAAALAQDALVR